MSWDSSSSLAGLVVRLESAERRIALGERSDALRQEAMRIYGLASARNNAAQSAWKQEVLQRAEKSFRCIDYCAGSVCFPRLSSLRNGQQCCGGLVENIRVFIRLPICQCVPQTIHTCGAIAQIGVADQLLHADRIVFQQQVHNTALFT